MRENEQLSVVSQTTRAIVSDDDVMGGEPRIEGRRITVRQVKEWVEDGGEAPEAVAERHDLALADVYRALAYYHDHPDEMAAVAKAREATERTAREGGAVTLDDLRERAADE
jgi:uncharacterized protein (DUF433 family)